MSGNEGPNKITELLKDASIAMLTTLSPEGKLISRPMAIQEAEFDGDLWFVFSEDSPKAQQIKDEAEVNVSFQAKHAFVSLAGRGNIVRDRAKLEEYWSAGVDAWFPDGIETPGVALLKVESESAQYWEASGGPIKMAVEVLKSRGSDREPDLGDSSKVDL
ncbi:pyridoxamine 5'-phosphate oxidase family protein [Arthrobacter rhombi]|uniref:pyridoxamine 5'-phosphate oxidase family protein n=1 Tax=Arthrobacter rhombi TaxID=71253 RepID=UPI003FD43063